MASAPKTEDMGIGDAVRTVSEKASSIARLEVELALLELKQKAANLGIGVGLSIGVIFVALYALGFGLATLAAGLATQMAAWLALLIVFLFLLLLGAVLGFIAVKKFQGAKPLPEQAIAEAKITKERFLDAD